MPHKGPNGEGFCNSLKMLGAGDFRADSVEYYEMIIENIGDIFWVFDINSNKHIYVSPAFDQILGYPREKVIDNLDFVKSMFYPDDIRFYHKIIGEILDAKKSDEFYRLITSEGNVRWFRSISSPVFDKEDKHTHTVGIARDITERRVAQGALEDSKEHYRKLAESNRQLVMEVNHRVRNNLAGLHSLIKLTKKNSDSIDQFADSIVRKIQVMSLAHDMLSHSGWKEIDLRTLLRCLSSNIDGLNTPNYEILLEGPVVRLCPRQVMPFVLTLSELFSVNDQTCHPSGFIQLNWDLFMEDESKWLRMTWNQKNLDPSLRMKNCKDCWMTKTQLAEDLVKGFIEFELEGRCDLKKGGLPCVHTIEFPLKCEKHKKHDVDMSGYI